MLVKQLAASLGFAPASEQPALAHEQICQADLLCASARAEEAPVPLEPTPFNLIGHQGPQQLDSKLVLQVPLYRSGPSYHAATSYSIYAHLPDPPGGRPHRFARVPLRYTRHAPPTYRPHRARPVPYRFPSGRLVPVTSPWHLVPYDIPLASASPHPVKRPAGLKVPPPALDGPRPLVTGSKFGHGPASLGLRSGSLVAGSLIQAALSGVRAISLPVFTPPYRYFPILHCVTYHSATIAFPLSPIAQLSPTRYFLNRTRTSTSSPAFKFDVAPRARRSVAQR